MPIVLIGLVAGLFGGLFGVGGGAIIVPGLIWLGHRAKVAAATSLVAVGITATAGAAAYAWYGEVHVPEALLLGIPAIGGVLVGAALQQRLHGRVLTALFAVFLAAVGIRLVIG
ncbi:MAG: TSUP family transporter [Gaiellaceae bacterium]